jgi:hypothetical protein
MSMFGEKRRKKSRNDERGGVREDIQMDAESFCEPKGMEQQHSIQIQTADVLPSSLCIKSYCLGMGRAS